MWAGAAAVTTMFIAAFAYSNWSLEILRLPYVWLYLIAMVLLIGLYIYRLENLTKYTKFMRKYHVIPIFILLLIVVCTILYFIGGR